MTSTDQPAATNAVGDDTPPPHSSHETSGPCVVAFTYGVPSAWWPTALSTPIDRSRAGQALSIASTPSAMSGLALPRRQWCSRRPGATPPDAGADAAAGRHPTWTLTLVTTPSSKELARPTCGFRASDCVPPLRSPVKDQQPTHRKPRRSLEPHSPFKVTDCGHRTLCCPFASRIHHCGSDVRLC